MNEIYEYHGFVITIFSDNGMCGIAVLQKYAHLVNATNYNEYNEIFEKNNIDLFEYDKHGDLIYKDSEIDCIIAHPDYDIYFRYLNLETQSDVLQYLCNEIDIFYGDTYKKQIVILRQKENAINRISKKKRGYKHNAWSVMIKERDKKCVKCGSVYKLQAHHIQSYKDNPAMRYDIDNGITLCSYCHKKTHKKRK